MPASQKSRERAFYAPFLLFIALMFLGEAVSMVFKSEVWYFSDPQYWVMPLQTVLCGAVVLFNWRHYDLGGLTRSGPNWGLAVGVGVLAFAIWIAPITLLDAAPRTHGFKPDFFGNDGWAYPLNVSFRFLRLVVVVPLVEEIFWRGFLMRWLVREKFTEVAFGTFQLKAFALVALFFMLEHGGADYPAAFLTGILYNAVAVRTKHLGACVLAHAVTNLLLGLFIMRTGQWGFW